MLNQNNRKAEKIFKSPIAFEICRKERVISENKSYKKLPFTYKGLPEEKNKNNEPCFFRSEETLTAEQANRLNLSPLRSWAICNHPGKPLGSDYVCPCLGCNSGCPGYIGRNSFKNSLLQRQIITEEDFPIFDNTEPEEVVEGEENFLEFFESVIEKVTHKRFLNFFLFFHVQNLPIVRLYLSIIRLFSELDIFVKIFLTVAVPNKKDINLLKLVRIYLRDWLFSSEEVRKGKIVLRIVENDPKLHEAGKHFTDSFIRINKEITKSSDKEIVSVLRGHGKAISHLNYSKNIVDQFFYYWAFDSIFPLVFLQRVITFYLLHFKIVGTNLYFTGNPTRSNHLHYAGSFYEIDSSVLSLEKNPFTNNYADSRYYVERGVIYHLERLYSYKVGKDLKHLTPFIGYLFPRQIENFFYKFRKSYTVFGYREMIKSLKDLVSRMKISKSNLSFLFVWQPFNSLFSYIRKQKSFDNENYLAGKTVDSFLKEEAFSFLTQPHTSEVSYETFHQDDRFEIGRVEVRYKEFDLSVEYLNYFVKIFAKSGKKQIIDNSQFCQRLQGDYVVFGIFHPNQKLNILFPLFLIFQKIAHYFFTTRKNIYLVVPLINTSENSFSRLIIIPKKLFIELLENRKTHHDFVSFSLSVKEENYRALLGLGELEEIFLPFPFLLVKINETKN